MSGTPADPDTGMASGDPWPRELRYSKDDRTLTVTFDDGRVFALPAEYLRVHSPSAEVQGHGPDQRQVIAGRAEVGIMKIEPVGNYAVRIHFDDLHDTGLFTWPYLRELGENQDEWWARYLRELEERGLSRDPRAGRR